MTNGEFRQRLETVFTPPQVEVLADWMEAHQRSLVKASDFNELKEIVRDIGETQQRTAVRMEELATAQQRTEVKVAELATAQQRTEVRMEELATAQQRTEGKVEGLTEAVQRLAESQAEMRQSFTASQEEMRQSFIASQEELRQSFVESQAELRQSFTESQAAMQQTMIEMQGAITQLARGLDETRSLTGANAQTLGYMLENEAYRNLPVWLKEHRGIEVLGRIIRQQVGGEEINLLVEARQGAEEVVIVGEAKGRLHLSDLGVLASKVEAVQEEYANLGERRIVPLLVAHFAPEKVLRKAAQEGIIVVQSFEW